MASAAGDAVFAVSGNGQVAASAADLLAIAANVGTFNNGATIVSGGLVVNQGGVVVEQGGMRMDSDSLLIQSATTESLLSVTSTDNQLGAWRSNLSRNLLHLLLLYAVADCRSALRARHWDFGNFGFVCCLMWPCDLCLSSECNCHHCWCRRPDEQLSPH